MNILHNHNNTNPQEKNVTSGANTNADISKVFQPRNSNNKENIAINETSGNLSRIQESKQIAKEKFYALSLKFKTVYGEDILVLIKRCGGRAMSLMEYLLKENMQQHYGQKLEYLARALELIQTENLNLVSSLTLLSVVAHNPGINEIDVAFGSKKEQTSRIHFRNIFGSEISVHGNMAEVYKVFNLYIKHYQDYAKTSPRKIIFEQRLKDKRDGKFTKGTYSEYKNNQ